MKRGPPILDAARAVLKKFRKEGELNSKHFILKMAFSNNFSMN
jgi:hypothetical protein